MKKLIWILGVIIILIVVILVILLTKLDPEKLGATVLEAVNKGGSVELKAEDFKLNVFKGLDMQQATVKSNLPSGTLTASLDRLLLEHEIAPLLKGELVVKQILIDKPKIEIATGVKKPPHTPAKPPREKEMESDMTTGTIEDSDDNGLTFSLDMLRLRDGEFSLKTADPKGQNLEMKGFNLDIDNFRTDPAAANAFLGVTASGGITISELQAGTAHFSKAKGGFTLDKGQIRLEGLGVSTHNSLLEVKNIEIDLTKPSAPYSLSANGKMDLNSVLGYSGKDGYGPVDLSFDARGVGPDTENMKGKGILNLAQGKIAEDPILKKIELILGKGFISGTDYAKTTIKFQIQKNRIQVQPFELKGENLVIQGAGWADISGPLSFKIQINAPKGKFKTQEISTEQLEGLSDGRDWAKVPIVIEGTLQNPDVGLDKSAIAEALKQGVKGAIKDKLADKKSEKRAGRNRKKR